VRKQGETRDRALPALVIAKAEVDGHLLPRAVMAVQQIERRMPG
jgi:hypothetical protein